MNEFKKKQWTRIGLSLVAVILAVLFLTGIVGGKSMTYQVEEPLTPMMQGIVDTMAQNAENSVAEDYLELDPYLVNIYEGYGFAKDYLAARGHAYTLEDVAKTKRPHDQAKCITCKTPDFTKMVNEEGVGVYTRSFDEVMGQMTQAISCYTCHGDDKGNNGQIVITHSYVQEAMGENANDIDPKVLNCGQCHIEYYFTPENQETMMPYSSQEGMTPEAILAYYDEIGFKDWEQPGTGTPMLKAQHPEMETFLYSTHSTMGLNCASCHMAEETAEDGSTYHSHYLVSPLQSETLMETCAACHGSADAARTLVTSTQEKVTSRETEVGNRLSGLKDELTVAVSEGRLTEEELATVRQLHREAQWFFDFCYVENSEGAHNSKLSIRCLDTADEKIAEAMALLTGEVPEEPVVEEEQAGTDGRLAGVTVQGFGGEVTVNLGLNPDQTVQTLSIETPNETPGLGQRASEEAFTSQFIGKAGPFTYGEDGIEALSGATVTSNAVLEAINGLIDGAKLSTDLPAEEEKSAETNESGALEFTEHGFGGEVTVHLELNEDRTVKSLAIDTPNETAGLGQRASEADFTDQFVGKAGPFAYGENGIDALSGATVTSNAVLTAINRAFSSATTEEEPAQEAAVEETTDAPAEKVPAKAEEESTTDGLMFGGYLSEKETNFSIIRVMISTKNDKITDCRITSEAKSEGSDFLTDEIRKEWAKAIVENQTAETDAITGATLQFSAAAVKEAVAEIQQQITGTAEEVPVEEAAEEKPEEKVPAEEAAEEKSEEEAPVEEAAEEKPEEEVLAEDAVEEKPEEVVPAEEPVEEKPEEVVPAEEPVEEKPEEVVPAEEAAEEKPEEEVPAEEAVEEKPEEEAPAEEPAEGPEEEAAKAETAAAPALYGSYLAEKETSFSIIRVIITAEKGVITNCRITSEGKSEGNDFLTDEIKTEWAKAIVENQTADMDAISSATLQFSSGAVQEAVNEILQKITGQ